MSEQIVTPENVALTVPNKDAKINLLDLNRQQMREFFKNLGEKPFRADQVMKWMYHYCSDDFDEMTDINKVLRNKLKEVAVIRAPQVVEEQRSSDGTIKWAIAVGDQRVETVYIPEDDRATLCVSSQVGCALECKFCSTAQQGFNRNLKVSEIIGQVWRAAKIIGAVKTTGVRPITNVVMMGMGEPLLNFDNVVTAMSIMMEDLGYGISKRKVTLSTSGVVPMIDKLAEVTDVSLALSLHAPNDELRNKLVPINKKYPLEMLLDSCYRYITRLGKERVLTIEYTLLAGVNDQPEHAEQLIALLKDFPCKINLIPFNPFPHSGYERPSNNAIRRFQDMLHKSGFNVTVRTTRGDDIDAACGQLVGQVMDRTRRSERYIAVRQLAAEAEQATPANNRN